MDSEARQRFIEGKKSELVSSLDQHIDTLETLDTSTSFNFDIASELHPEILDNTTKEGREALTFYQKLYQNLEEGVKYLAFRRVTVGHAPGVCTGLGGKPVITIDHASITVVENPTADDFVFERDEHGIPIVRIVAESTHVSSEDVRSDTLFDGNDWRSLQLPELFTAKTDLEFITETAEHLIDAPKDIRDTYNIEYLPLHVTRGLVPLNKKVYAASLEQVRQEA